METRKSNGIQFQFFFLFFQGENISTFQTGFFSNQVTLSRLNSYSLEKFSSVLRYLKKEKSRLAIPYDTDFITFSLYRMIFIASKHSISPIIYTFHPASGKNKKWKEKKNLYEKISSLIQKCIRVLSGKRFSFRANNF